MDDRRKLQTYLFAMIDLGKAVYAGKETDERKRAQAAYALLMGDLHPAMAHRRLEGLLDQERLVLRHWMPNTQYENFLIGSIEGEVHWDDMDVLYVSTANGLDLRRNHEGNYVPYHLEQNKLFVFSDVVRKNDFRTPRTVALQFVGVESILPRFGDDQPLDR